MAVRQLGPKDRSIGICIKAMIPYTTQVDSEIVDIVGRYDLLRSITKHFPSITGMGQISEDNNTADKPSRSTWSDNTSPAVTHVTTPFGNLYAVPPRILYPGYQVIYRVF